MPRNALALGGAALIGLLSACQSGGPSSSAAPEPAPAPAETTAAAPTETAAPPPVDDAAPASSDAEAPADDANGRPSVMLEGRDLMSLDALPPRGPVPTADVPAGDLTTGDGIFTLDQAARGAELVKNTCSECHEPADWRESGFLTRWAGESTYQLWYYINNRMPYRNPWSLSRQQVTDALSYILYINELPAGDQEMGTDDDSIDDFWIVWNAPTATSSSR
jgi:hypothetical protein